jgi:hypothetical protein
MIEEIVTKHNATIMMTPTVRPMFLAIILSSIISLQYLR